MFPTVIQCYSSHFSALEEKDTIKAALKIFEEKTCLKFKSRSEESNWIVFKKLDGYLFFLSNNGSKIKHHVF